MRLCVRLQEWAHLILKKFWHERESGSEIANLFEFFKVLCVKFVFYFRNKGSFHLIQFVPINALKPRMSLINIKKELNISDIKFSAKEDCKDYNGIRINTFISSAPLVPSRCSTLQRSLHIRSFASLDNLASSGNFKWCLQLTICINRMIQCRWEPYEENNNGIKTNEQSISIPMFLILIWCYWLRWRN